MELNWLWHIGMGSPQVTYTKYQCLSVFTAIGYSWSHTVLGDHFFSFVFFSFYFVLLCIFSLTSWGGSPFFFCLRNVGKILLWSLTRHSSCDLADRWFWIRSGDLRPSPPLMSSGKATHGCVIALGDWCWRDKWALHTDTLALAPHDSCLLLTIIRHHREMEGYGIEVPDEPITHLPKGL